MDPAGQEGADGQHHAGRVKPQARLRHHACHAVAFDYQVIHGLLEQVQVVRAFQQGADDPFIQAAVDLRPGGPHCRTLAGVEDAELYSAPVRGGAHDPAQGVYLLHQVAFADTADGRVARHLPQGIDAVGQQQGTRAQARRGQGSLGPGVAAADDNHLVLLFTVAHQGRNCSN